MIKSQNEEQKKVEPTLLIKGEIEVNERMEKEFRVYYKHQCLQPLPLPPAIIYNGSH